MSKVLLDEINIEIELDDIDFVVVINSEEGEALCYLIHFKDGSTLRVPITERNKSILESYIRDSSHKPPKPR